MTRMTLPPGLERVMLEMEVAHRQAMIDAAKADPVKHKLTLQFDGPLRWLYYGGGIDRRGIRRRFCYSTTRNAAGYFLSWVEITDTKRGTGKRTKFVASKTRKLMAARAKRLWKSHTK